MRGMRTRVCEVWCLPVSKVRGQGLYVVDFHIDVSWFDDSNGHVCAGTDGDGGIVGDYFQWRKNCDERVTNG